MTYHSKMKTTKVYIHDSTYATPFSLMLWGPRIRHYRPEGRSKKKGIDVIVGKGGVISISVGDRKGCASRALGSNDGLLSLATSRRLCPGRDHW